MTEQATTESFEPNWANPPGATIAAILCARSLSRESFAKEIGENVETVQRLLLGIEVVDDNFADRLSQCLGSTPSFWKAREAQFRGDSERLQKKDTTCSLENWVKQFPIRDMVSLGWIREYKTTSEAADLCLKLFGVPDVSTWELRYCKSSAAAAFRISEAAGKSPGAVAAWLRWAELIASRTPCSPWNPEKFRTNLNAAKRLTWQKDPTTFLPRLRQLCAESGVAVVIARTPRGCPASGATKFLSDQKAMIVLSFRYRSDDHFWFTFFHEAGHLLLHKPEALFLEIETGDDINAHEEAEANLFAENIILTDDCKREITSLKLDATSVMRFAQRSGVAPGVIVGQLQHNGRLSRNRLNWLKRRYNWDKIEADQLIP